MWEGCRWPAWGISYNAGLVLRVKCRGVIECSVEYLANIMQFYDKWRALNLLLGYCSIHPSPLILLSGLSRWRTVMSVSVSGISYSLEFLLRKLEQLVSGRSLSFLKLFIESIPFGSWLSCSCTFDGRSHLDIMTWWCSANVVVSPLWKLWPRALNQC